MASGRVWEGAAGASEFCVLSCAGRSAPTYGSPSWLARRGDYASIGGGVDHEYHFRSCPDLHRYSHDLVREAFGWRVSSVVQEGLDNRAALRDDSHGFVRHGRRGYHCKHLRPPTEAALRCRCPAIQELRNGSDKLRGRERLRQHDAIRYTFGRPIFSVCAAHVYDGKRWIDLSGLLGDFPTVHPAPQTDVGYERAVFDQTTFTASSPEAAIAGSKPPSVRASSTIV